MGVVLQLSDVRLSFPKLEMPDYFKPGVQSRPGEKRRWSSAFHITPGRSTAQRVVGGKLSGDKGDAKKMIDDAMIEVAKEKFEKKWQLEYDNLITDPKACAWQNGARKEMAGVWILGTHRYESDGRPIVIDGDKSPIYKPNGEIYPEKMGRLYSGMYVNAQVEIWAQGAPNKGLRGGLLIIQRLKDGDAFSGGAAPQLDTMGEVEDGADAEDMS